MESASQIAAVQQKIGAETKVHGNTRCVTGIFCLARQRTTEASAPSNLSVPRADLFVKDAKAKLHSGTCKPHDSIRRGNNAGARARSVSGSALSKLEKRPVAAASAQSKALRPIKVGREKIRVVNSEVSASVKNAFSIQNSILPEARVSFPPSQQDKFEKSRRTEVCVAQD